MLPALAHYHGEDSSCQHADYTLGFDRVAFFYLSSTISGF